MVPRVAFPPVHHHKQLTTTLTPSQAQQHISSYLTFSESRAHLHPDSTLSSSGIRFSAHSGPSGGLALHHLRRIEAGLRGENLAIETEEDLARFQEQNGGVDGLPEGDDSRLDALIDEGKRGSKKRKRDEAIAEWAENSSQVVEDADGSPPRLELESFANTPLHKSDWQEQEDYEREQKIWEGEVGERDGAPAVQQYGSDEEAPEIVEHDDDGNVQPKENGNMQHEEDGDVQPKQNGDVQVNGKKGKHENETKEERKARRAAKHADDTAEEKKARKEAKRAKKAAKAGKG